jgi:hypothetical protein
MQTSTVHTTDVVLSNAAIQKGVNDYMGMKIFPGFNSALQTAKILSIDPTGDLRRRKNTARAPGTAANRSGVDITRPVRFACEDHAQAELIPDEHRAVMGPMNQPALDATDNAMDRLRLDFEIEVRDIIDNAASATDITTSSPTNKWDDPAGDPIGDLKRKIHELKENSGVKPNRVALDSAVLDFIAENPDFIDRVKYNQIPAASGTATALSQLVGLEPGAIVSCNIALQNQSKEGQAEDLVSIWGDRVLLYYAEPVKIKTMNFGMTVLWNHPDLQPRAMGGVAEGIRVVTYRDDSVSSDVVEAHWYYDILMLQPLVAHLFTNTTTSLS